MKVSIERFSLIAMVIFLTILMYQNCQRERRIDQLTTALRKSNLDNIEFHVETLKDSSRVWEQGQIILTEKDAKEAALIQAQKWERKFKDIQSQVGFTETTVIDTFFVPIDTALVNEIAASEDSSSLLTDIPVSIYERWFALSGTMQMRKGLLIDSLRVNNEYSVIIGSTKDGLFKKRKPVVVVRNANPYSNPTSMTNVIIEEQDEFYEKWWFWAGSGSIVTMILTIWMGA